MPSKKELQALLKEKYDINLNVSQALSAEECELLLTSLQGQPHMRKLVESFAEKNTDLGRRNRHFGSLRSSAEKRLEKLQTDYQQLEDQIAQMEQAKVGLVNRKQVITAETQALEADIQRLNAEKQYLDKQVKVLSSQNSELTDANQQLKKDNKDLKNVVDQIRLRLAKDTKELLRYEDSEIRKALIRLFRWTLG